MQASQRAKEAARNGQFVAGTWWYGKQLLCVLAYKCGNSDGASFNVMREFFSEQECLFVQSKIDARTASHLPPWPSGI